MITKNQVTELGYRVFQKGYDLNKKHIVGERIPLKDLLPGGVSESFVKKTEGRFVIFDKEGKNVSTQIYLPRRDAYATMPGSYAYIGMYFRPGIKMETEDAFKVGDVLLYGIEREEIQKEREFTWKESHEDFDMELE